MTRRGIDGSPGIFAALPELRDGLQAEMANTVLTVRPPTRPVSCHRQVSVFVFIATHGNGLPTAQSSKETALTATCLNEEHPSRRAVAGFVDAKDGSKEGRLHRRDPSQLKEEKYKVVCFGNSRPTYLN